MTSWTLRHFSTSKTFIMLPKFSKSWTKHWDAKLSVNVFSKNTAVPLLCKRGGGGIPSATGFERRSLASSRCFWQDTGRQTTYQRMNDESVTTVYDHIEAISVLESPRTESMVLVKAGRLVTERRQRNTNFGFRRLKKKRNVSTVRMTWCP